MSDAATILLVDDSRFFLTMERQFLRDTAARIVEAKNAEEAMAYCRRERPDLIYMDFDLPGTSGADCCRRLKEERGLDSIPVILICDESRPDHLQACRQVESDGLMTKPLDRRRFLELGRSLLAGIRESRRECLLRVRCRRGSDVFMGKGLDISSGGLFLQCDEDLQVGDSLKLEIQLSRPEEKGPWVYCTGSVVWVNRGDKPFKPNHPEGFGIRFTVLSNQTAAILNGFLKSAVPA